MEKGGILLRVLIADDEPLAREELMYLLGQIDDVEVVAQASDGQELLVLLNQEAIDVVFLDIQMPKLTGLAVVHALRALEKDPPLFVFVTAYDEYAVHAFELEAVDYVLKPFDKARVMRALGRVRRLLMAKDEKQQAGDATGRLEGRLDGKLDGKLESEEAKRRYASPIRTVRLVIDEGERLVVLNPSDVIYAVREGRGIQIHTEAQTVESRMTLSELEEKLMGYDFLRVHRSYLVNLDYIEAITPWFNGAYTLLLRDAARSTVPVSRAAAKHLFERLGRH